MSGLNFRYRTLLIRLYQSTEGDAFEARRIFRRRTKERVSNAVIREIWRNEGLIENNRRKNGKTYDPHKIILDSYQTYKKNPVEVARVLGYDESFVRTIWRGAGYDF
ncbi:hypothetical protein HY448_00930 [Candidatus Pacearchaeota archaeon]|nr:hypothetical protein [Candidatus Pacearchaeota archaeon]